MIEPGDTFDGFDRQGHLYIVLSSRLGTGEVAIVNLTPHYAVHARHGEFCLIIKPHEHPWIRRDSCVYFQEARLERLKTIRELMESDALRSHPRCAPVLLRRTQEEALSSEEVSSEVKDAIRASLANDPR